MIACIVLGLEYLRTRQVIHRDIKPENIVLDDKGYLRITDFGIARKLKPDNSEETSGTPGYMGNLQFLSKCALAPEVLCRQNHSYSADYFALGVIAYELMLGKVIMVSTYPFKRPYQGRSRHEIKQAVLYRQVKITKNCLPYGWSDDAVDFINTVKRSMS